MPSPLVYNVLTEFRFEIGHAMLGSEKLAGAVDQVSQAADNALFSFQRLGAGIVASMGLGTGGLLGVLGLALQVSDKFAQSQRDIANIITSNTGGTMSWADALMSAESTMSNINKKAQEFSLSTADLLSTSKQLGAVLLSHGLDDTSLKKSVELSRQYLKSAPTLGVDPGLAQQQLIRAVLGQASGNDTLFNRLTGETSAGKPFGGAGGTKAFNALTPAKRLDVLTKALAQFSSNSNYVYGNAKSLSGEMRRLGEAIKGPFSIFRSLGDVLMGPVLSALSRINDYINKQGRQIVESLSKMMKKSLETPEQIVATLMQLRSLKADVGMTGTIFAVIGGLKTLFHVMQLFGIALPGLGTIILSLGGVTAVIAGIFAGLTYVVVTLIPFVIGLAAELLAILAIVQLISRAIAYAEIADAKDLAELAPRFAEAIRLFKVAFQPLFDLFDELAKAISPLFKLSLYAKILVAVLEALAYTFVAIRAIFEGVMAAIWELYVQIYKLFSGQGFDWSAIWEAYKSGVDRVMAEAFGGVESGDAVVNQTTNIGKVEIKNQFKENMEPDRIAFSLTKQLAKVAQNPTQARSRQFAPVAGGA